MCYKNENLQVLSLIFANCPLTYCCLMTFTTYPHCSPSYSNHISKSSSHILEGAIYHAQFNLKTNVFGVWVETGAPQVISLGTCKVHADSTKSHIKLESLQL